MSRNRTMIGLFLSLVAILFAGAALVTPMKVYAQVNATSPMSSSSGTTMNNTTSGTNEFKTLRDQYLAQWQKLNFQSGFDKLVEDGSVQGYGVYKEHPSNIYNIDARSIVLYVEPVGYGYNEGVDEAGNTLYSFNFSAVITLSDSQGKPLTEPITAEFGDMLNSHNKATEAYMPITLTLDKPLPVGRYTITYDVTDGTSGKIFQIVKDIRVAETIR